MTLKFAEYHDCEGIRPPMYRLQIVTDTKGIWPFKRTIQRNERVWEPRDAEWKCPECDSEWEYRGTGGYLDSGWWLARTRRRYFVDQNGRTVGSTIDRR